MAINLMGKKENTYCVADQKKNPKKFIRISTKTLETMHKVGRQKKLDFLADMSSTPSADKKIYFYILNENVDSFLPGGGSAPPPLSGHVR